jgi:hypothetical protein
VLHYVDLEAKTTEVAAAFDETALIFAISLCFHSIISKNGVPTCYNRFRIVILKVRDDEVRRDSDD